MNLFVQVTAPNGATVATHFPRDTDVKTVRDWASFEFIKQEHIETDKNFLVFAEQRVTMERSIENYGNATEGICFHLRLEAIPSGGSEKAHAHVQSQPPNCPKCGTLMQEPTNQTTSYVSAWCCPSCGVITGDWERNGVNVVETATAVTAPPYKVARVRPRVLSEEEGAQVRRELGIDPPKPQLSDLTVSQKVAGFIESQRVSSRNDQLTSGDYGEDSELKSLIHQLMQDRVEEEARQKGLLRVEEWIAVLKNGDWRGAVSEDLGKLETAPSRAWVDGENHAYLTLMYGSPANPFLSISGILESTHGATAAHTLINGNNRPYPDATFANLAQQLEEFRETFSSYPANICVNAATCPAFTAYFDEMPPVRLSPLGSLPIVENEDVPDNEAWFVNAEGKKVGVLYGIGGEPVFVNKGDF